VKINIRPLEGLKILKTLSRTGLISFLPFLKTMGNSSLVEFFCGKTRRYMCFIVTDGGEVKHVLYLLVDNGKMKEIGTLDTDEKTMGGIYKELQKKGEIAKIIKYDVSGGGLAFHPMN